PSAPRRWKTVVLSHPDASNRRCGRLLRTRLNAGLGDCRPERRRQTGAIVRARRGQARRGWRFSDNTIGGWQAIIPRSKHAARGGEAVFDRPVWPRGGWYGSLRLKWFTSR